MNRRTLLKTLGISAIGLATVPLWIDSWTTDSLPREEMDLDDHQRAVLAELVGVIIPDTDTPGAKQLEVDKFILTMLANCYENEMRVHFAEGLNKLDNSSQSQYHRDYLKATGAQRNEITRKMLNEPAKSDGKPNFIAFTKGLTITGYLTSEYVMRDILNYEFVPSRFYGSIPLEEATPTTPVL